MLHAGEINMSRVKHGDEEVECEVEEEDEEYEYEYEEIDSEEDGEEVGEEEDDEEYEYEYEEVDTASDDHKEVGKGGGGGGGESAKKDDRVAKGSDRESTGGVKGENFSTVFTANNNSCVSTTATEETADSSSVTPMVIDNDSNSSTISSTSTAAGASMDWIEPVKLTRKSIDMLLAEAEEEFELRETEIDAAVKALRISGKEVQKLATIRNFYQLLTDGCSAETEREEAVRRVLPAIQEVLNDAEHYSATHLDMHCEAAVVYKKILRDKRLGGASEEKGKSVDGGGGGGGLSQLGQKLLTLMLENVEKQGDNVNAAAWLESLIELLDDCVPISLAAEKLIPMVVSQSSLKRRVQRRVIAARMVEKLACILPSDLACKELPACALKLCQDPSPTVRSAMAQRLGTISQAIKGKSSDSMVTTLLLPCYNELCRDDDPSVREAMLNSLADSLPHFDEHTRRFMALPLLRKCVEQALLLRDSSLSVVAKQMGPWLESLKAVLSEAELRWFLNTYCRLVDLAGDPPRSSSITSGSAFKPPASSLIGAMGILNEGGGLKRTSLARSKTPPHHVGGGGASSTDEEEDTTSSASTSTSTTTTTATSLMGACRRMCAHNFPCFAMIYSREQFHQCLLPLLKRLCRDADEEVRCSIASGFHEVVQLRSLEEQPLLLPHFVELLAGGGGSGGGGSDVVQRLTATMHRSLPPIYKGVQLAIDKDQQQQNAGQKSEKLLVTSFPPSATSLVALRRRLDKLLLGCNQLLRGGGAWRSHEAYLNNIAVVRHYVAISELQSGYQTMLQEEVLNARALPCRIAAAQSLLLIMREYPLKRARRGVIEFFIDNVGRNASCHRRRLLLDIVPHTLKHFSREFFVKELLAPVLAMANDPVSNIRVQLFRLLPLIRRHLSFSSPDTDSLALVERCARDMLAAEQHPSTQQLLHHYSPAVLERRHVAAAHPDHSSIMAELQASNRAKLAEERRLWTERESFVTAGGKPAAVNVTDYSSSAEQEESPAPRQLAARKELGGVVKGLKAAEPLQQMKVVFDGGGGVKLAVAGWGGASNSSGSMGQAVQQLNKMEKGAAAGIKQLAVVRPLPQVVKTAVDTEEYQPTKNQQSLRARSPSPMPPALHPPSSSSGGNQNGFLSSPVNTTIIKSTVDYQQHAAPARAVPPSKPIKTNNDADLTQVGEVRETSKLLSETPSTAPTTAVMSSTKPPLPSTSTAHSYTRALKSKSHHHIPGYSGSSLLPSASYHSSSTTSYASPFKSVANTRLLAGTKGHEGTPARNIGTSRPSLGISTSSFSATSSSSKSSSMIPTPTTSSSSRNILEGVGGVEGMKGGARKMYRSIAAMNHSTGPSSSSADKKPENIYSASSLLMTNPSLSRVGSSSNISVTATKSAAPSRHHASAMSHSAYGSLTYTPFPSSGSATQSMNTHLSESTSSGGGSSSGSSRMLARLPYGLLKVQSTSAVERKPTQISIKQPRSTLMSTKSGRHYGDYTLGGEGSISDSEMVGSSSLGSALSKLTTSATITRSPSSSQQLTSSTSTRASSEATKRNTTTAMDYSPFMLGELLQQRRAH